LDFYGYNSPYDGKYRIDDEVYTLGEDYRSVKRYKEYINAGFTILLLQHTNSYNGEDFEKSACKKCMDTAYRAGIKKIIVSDQRLKDLCEEKLLTDGGGRFFDESGLDAYIVECTKPYRKHPAFYGVQLFDEPAWHKLKAYAIVHRAVKRAGIEPQSNLLNMCAPKLLAENPSAPEKDYEDYLNYFVENSKTEYLMTDEYPFRRNNVISNFTVPTYQILAKVCKERHIELRLVMQSFSQEGCVPLGGKLDGGISWRRMTEPDMYWQLNLAMGFGCREFSFFTYFTKFVKHFKGLRAVSDGIDGAAFVNLDGSRTKLYYYTRRIISEMKEFEKILLKYTFEGAYFFFPEGKTFKDYESTERAIVQGNCPITVKPSQDPYIVTELKSTQSKLFMIQNIGNPMDKMLHGKRAGSAEIEIKSFADKAKFYYRGKRVQRKLTDGKMIEKLSCGQAIFVEI
jgi:hypothetical protein